jgi:hypothetical protein
MREVGITCSAAIRARGSLHLGLQVSSLPELGGAEAGHNSAPNLVASPTNESACVDTLAVAWRISLHSADPRITNDMAVPTNGHHGDGLGWSTRPRCG